MQNNILQIIIISLFLFISGVGISYSQDTIQHKVFFNFNKSQRISEVGSDKLFRIISDIKIQEIDEITLVGYCDDRGSTAYNMKLAQKRIDYIVRIIKSNIGNVNLIFIKVPKGEVQILNSDFIKDERRQNRRVDIYYVKSKKNEPIGFIDIEEESVIKNHEIIDTIDEKDFFVNKNLAIKEIKPHIINKKIDSMLYKNLFLGKHIGDTILTFYYRDGLNVIFKESKSHLDDLFLSMKHNESTTIKISVFASSTKKGVKELGVEHLKHLSKKKAKAVYDYLVNKGIDKKRMSYDGLGFVPIDGRVPRKLNPKDQRVEITITDK